MIMKIKHHERALKVENYIKRNKLFTIISIIMIIYLVVNSITSSFNPKPKEDNPTTLSSEEDNPTTLSSEEDKPEENNDSTTLRWKFYSVDLWILLVGGGFCSIMIVRERKMMKEKL